MKPLHIAEGKGVLEQNARAFDFAEGFSVGHDPKGRYRERTRYAGRYSERYGERYGVGQKPPTYPPPTQGAPTPGSVSATPPGGGGGPDCFPCQPFITGQTGAAHGRRVYYGKDADYSCAIRPPRCDCHVIGGNTLNSTVLPTGVATTAFADVTLDSGDASYFVPYYMHIVALEVGATADLSVTGLPLLVLMSNSRSGQEPNMRRASTTDASFGVPTLGYGQEKELECVDWHRFASVNNQQLVLTFNNPQTVAVHIFVNLWGLVAA